MYVITGKKKSVRDKIQDVVVCMCTYLSLLFFNYCFFQNHYREYLYVGKQTSIFFLLEVITSPVRQSRIECNGVDITAILSSLYDTVFHRVIDQLFINCGKAFLCANGPKMIQRLREKAESVTRQRSLTQQEEQQVGQTKISFSSLSRKN